MLRQSAIASMVVAAAILGARAEAPHVYAIRGARLVTGAGRPIESGTLIIRGGLIEAAGAAVTTPADAVVIEGKGLTVYPGLIDMGTSAGLDVPAAALAQNPRTREDAERSKRHAILRPHVHAARYLRADATDLRRLAPVGITSVLAVPPGEVVRGHSALVNVALREDDPQIGNVADERRGLYVVRTPVALHVGVPNRPRGDGYPESLMGVIAFVRQAFLDASHYQLEQAAWSKGSRLIARPAYDEALDALQPALGRRVPVAFAADRAREIRRALAMAQEMGLDPIIEGGVEADQVAAELKARGARVLVSVNYPTRPRVLAPDADEPIAELRRRANAPKVAGALDQAGVPFAFASDGLREPKDFVANAAKAVKAGLSADAAVKALTIGAATIAGVADRLGSLERGKIANVLVTEGGLFDDKMTVRHVFVDGRPIALGAAEAPSNRGGRPGVQ